MVYNILFGSMNQNSKIHAEYKTTTQYRNKKKLKITIVKISILIFTIGLPKEVLITNNYFYRFLSGSITKYFVSI